VMTSNGFCSNPPLEVHFGAAAGYRRSISEPPRGTGMTSRSSSRAGSRWSAGTWRRGRRITSGKTTRHGYDRTTVCAPRRPKPRRGIFPLREGPCT
jgi:hypothetical protein